MNIRFLEIVQWKRVLFGLFSVLERSQARENTQTLERTRYIQAHPSESFGVFAQRLAKQMVSREKKMHFKFYFSMVNLGCSIR